MEKKAKRDFLFAVRPLVAAMALNLLNVFMTVNAQCQYYQEVLVGQRYYIFNVEYPGNYRRGTNCRWTAKGLPGTKIVMSCEEVNLPESRNCQSDKLSISLTGDKTFADARNFCGNGTLSLVSENNEMEIGLFSNYLNFFQGTGRFICTITSIQATIPTTTTRRPVTCDCGWKQGMRIVGGHETGINEYPFMAGLVDYEAASVSCGATIISERYAITAAHCLTNRLVAEIGLLVGGHNLTSATPYAQIYPHEKFIIHPEFNPTTQNNDVAITRTRYTITFSLYVGPVCLPFRYTGLDLKGFSVTALGWGSKDFSEPLSDVLQEVSLTVIGNDQCRQTEHAVTDKELCTYTPHKDTCQSDSGGPLVWMVTSIRRLELVGIISYGVGCATKRPSVNARVTTFLSWIVGQTTDTNYCIR